MNQVATYISVKLGDLFIDWKATVWIMRCKMKTIAYNSKVFYHNRKFTRRKRKKNLRGKNDATHPNDKSRKISQTDCEDSPDSWQKFFHKLAVLVKSANLPKPV